jgi:DNA polymerase III epsilon subunit-like protein
MSLAGPGFSGLYSAQQSGLVLQLLLAQPDILIVGHNIAFDTAVLLRAFPHLVTPLFEAYEMGRISDTAIRQKLIDLSRGELDNVKRPRPDRVGRSAYSLEALAKRHFSKVLDKHTWRLRYGELASTTPFKEWPDGARHYAIEDAVVTRDLYAKQGAGRDAFHETTVSPDEYNQMRHAFWLQLCSVHGFKTDVARAQRLGAKIEAEIATIEKSLFDAGLLRPKSKKNPAPVRCTKIAQGLLEAACAKRGIEVPRTEPSAKFEDGQTQVNFAACEASGDPTLLAYGRYTQLQALLNKDIKALLQGEIHARFNSLLENGRTSSGDDKATGGGYNIQNPARKGGVRECFVAREGHVLVDSDYDGLELRTMAQACLWLLNRSTLAPVLNAGEDPHLMVAAQMAGCSYGEAKQRKELLDAYERGDIKECSPEARDIGEKRQLSKPCNFGWPGGMGPPTFIEYAATQQVYVTLEQAYRLRDVWRATWPEFPEAYFPLHEKLTQECGTTNVEAFISRRMRGKCKYTAACNDRFSSLAADAAKHAMWRITRDAYDPSRRSVLLGSRMVAYVHDQILQECKESVGHECALEIQRIMIEAGKTYTPDVPLTTTPVLSRCWSKKAKAVRDNAGRLIPWEYHETP